MLFNEKKRVVPNILFWLGVSCNFAVMIYLHQTTQIAIPPNEEYHDAPENRTAYHHQQRVNNITQSTATATVKQQRHQANNDQTKVPHQIERRQENRENKREGRGWTDTAAGGGSEAAAASNITSITNSNSNQDQEGSGRHHLPRTNNTKTCTCGNWGEWYNAGKPTPSCCLRQTAETIMSFIDLFERKNISYTPSGGGLISVVRCGSLAGYEYDADIEIFSTSQEALQPIFNEWVKEEKKKRWSAHAMGRDGRWVEVDWQQMGKFQ